MPEDTPPRVLPAGFEIRAAKNGMFRTFVAAGGPVVEGQLLFEFETAEEQAQLDQIDVAIGQIRERLAAFAVGGAKEDQFAALSAAVSHHAAESAHALLIKAQADIERLEVRDIHKHVAEQSHANAVAAQLAADQSAFEDDLIRQSFVEARLYSQKLLDNLLAMRTQITGSLARYSVSAPVSGDLHLAEPGRRVAALGTILAVLVI